MHTFIYAYSPFMYSFKLVLIYLSFIHAQIKSENSFWSKDMIRIRKVHQTLTKRHNEGGEASRKIR